MDNRFKRRKYFCIFFLVIIALYLVQVLNIVYYPSTINVIKGEDKKLNTLFPFTIKVIQDDDNIIKCDSEYSKFDIKKSYKVNTIETGIAKLQFKFLGILPIKNIDVNIIDRAYLVPGGNSIGVKLNTKGVLVVAISDIISDNGNKYSPAKNAGIKVGDSIIEINGNKVRDAQHVSKLLNQVRGEKVNIVVERNNIKFSTVVEPVKSIQDNCYRLGIWVRDKTAGIGTLTFYDKVSNVFGALGHGINDTDTKKLLNVKDGKIMRVKISNIQQGQKGSPGEIKGIFYNTDDLLGTVTQNTQFGIFGILHDNFIKDCNLKPMPIGFQREVKEGKAYILTTIDDNKVKKYEIEIVKTQPQSTPQQKSMIIQVTDKQLLKKTGGIVQGMSGSPIIQDGKIVGAITHVFVNDPTKGYGIYIEWMLKQSDLDFKNNYKLTQSQNK